MHSGCAVCAPVTLCGCYRSLGLVGRRLCFYVSTGPITGKLPFANITPRNSQSNYARAGAFALLNLLI